MLIFLRSLFGIGRRTSHRLTAFSHNPNHISNTCSSSPSLVSPFIWLSCFICLIRFPFVSNRHFHNFDCFDKDSVREIVRKQRWDDFRIVSLFDSALAPIWASRVLVELCQDARLALRFFEWAKGRIGFQHTSEAYCILVHILFCARFYSDANAVLKELICLRRVLPSWDVFDLLWATRNVCVPGFGVFDALFSALIELGMLEEASECFLKMRKFRVFPKPRSCNALLHRLSKVGRGDLSRKFFKDMGAAGIKRSVFTYNIMIDYMCK